MNNNFLYIQLADELEKKIKSGDFAIGSKLPSVRTLHRKIGYSFTTVYESLIELERRNLVEARPKSGFYVIQNQLNILKTPQLKKLRIKPFEVQKNIMAESILGLMGNESIIPFGGCVPGPEILPLKKLTRAVRTISNTAMKSALKFDLPQGNIEFRREIAKQIIGKEGSAITDQIVVTNGCQEAIALCLKAITEPGDTVVVESPTCPGFFPLFEDLKLNALEIPTNPTTGIDLESLEIALESHDVKASLLVPNIHNPLGYVMPEINKKKIVQIFNERNIPIVEDGVYHDLYFGTGVLTTLKSYDSKDLVLYCSSFSKTLAPGLRVGWTIPGRFAKKIKRLKTNSSMSCSSFDQHIITECLKTGFYDRHHRKLRNLLKIQMTQMVDAIVRYFPENIKITQPEGGLLLWIELNTSIDALKVFKEALKRGVSIFPGIMFSTSNQYNNCIRLTYGHPFKNESEKGIALLGEIIKSFTN